VQLPDKAIHKLRITAGKYDITAPDVTGSKMLPTHERIGKNNQTKHAPTNP